MARGLCVSFVLLASLALAGCAGRAWEQARAEDTAAAYAQFVRDHEGSKYAQEARERSELVRIRARPTPETYQAFLESYPDSSLIPELRAIVEEDFFQRARAAGSVAAYRDFLDQFGAGRFGARARGNLAYLEARGFGGSPEALADFARAHPESDFAAEARRSSEAAARRAESAFRRLGVRIEVGAGTPEGDRLERVFLERVREACAGAGLSCVSLRRGEPSGLAAELRIQHREESVRTRLEASQVTSPGVRATTQLDLIRRGDERPIWSEEFSFHTLSASREGTSVLFGPGTDSYWSRFFVPAVGWASQEAVRSPRQLEKPVVAVDATSTHAFVLFGDGDFRIFEIGDPESPLLVGEYRRPRDLAHFEGLRVVGDRVLLFGEDGVEVVQLEAQGPRRVYAWGRGAIGSVVALAAPRAGIVAGGKRGLLLLSGEQPEPLIDRPVRGLALLGGERLVFTDGTSLFVSTIPLLRQRKVEGELRLGSGFGPGRLRVQGRTALVLGKRGLVRVDLGRPSQPRLLSRIDTNEVGEIRDAALLRGRLFLLGQRGLMLTDPQGERVSDSAALAARSRIDPSGRHLVAVGDDRLQVVDATPFVFRAAASRSPAGAEATSGR